MNYSEYTLVGCCMRRVSWGMGPQNYQFGFSSIFFLCCFCTVSLKRSRFEKLWLNRFEKHKKKKNKDIIKIKSKNYKEKEVCLCALNSNSISTASVRVHVCITTVESCRCLFPVQHATHAWLRLPRYYIPTNTFPISFISNSTNIIPPMRHI